MSNREDVLHGEVVDDEDGGDVDAPHSNFVEALIGHAINQGSEKIRATMREAAGKLAPYRIGLTGIVEGVAGPGTLALRVTLPGAKPTLITLPYVNTSMAGAQDARARTLVGHTVRLIVEIER